MGATGANKLAELAAELREQVPPQFIPKENATLRGDFAVAEPPAKPVIADIAFGESAFGIDDAGAAPAPKAPEPGEDTGLELEPEKPAPDFNVVDTPGESDIHEQREALTAVHEKADEEQRRIDAQTRKKISDGADIENSVNGFRTSVSWTGAGQAVSAEKRRKEDGDKATQAMLKKQLEEHLRWLDEQIKYWREQERVWEERGDAIAEAMERLERGERNDVYEDGLAIDPKLRDAQIAFQKRHNRLLDVNNSDDLLTLRRFQRDELAYARDQREQRERDRQEAREFAEDLEQNRTTPEAERMMQEKMQSAAGRRELAQTAALADDETRNVIHEQTAQTEQAQELAAIKRAGGSAFDSADDGFGDDDFGGGTSVAKNVDPLGFGQDSLRPGFAVAASGETAPAPEDPARHPDAVPTSGMVRSA